MKPDLDNILANLAVPGRVLAFCDETNLTEQATATLVADLRLHVGFVVPAENYQAIVEPLIDLLEAHGLPEFHASEVVNPKVNSPWYEVPYASRLEAFGRMVEVLEMPDARIPYLYLSRQDHKAMVAQSGGQIVGDYKLSLKTVFLSCMAEYLSTYPKPVLIIDREKNTPGPTQHVMSHPGNLLGGGAISVESHKVIGLQIADMAAYVVRRYLLKQGVLHADGGNPFDKLAARAVASFNDRFDFLLSPGSGNV